MAKNAKMKYNWSTDFTAAIPKYPYRKKKPEIIVLHDTANDQSTIDGEISYMKRNWQNAFVHAWAGPGKVVETANTDYVAWGAGGVANQRAIHIELVHTHNKKDFIDALDRYLFWVAYQCYWYDIKPVDATKTGIGTIWTHAAVSKFLGGTDHTDPMGYITGRAKEYGMTVTFTTMFKKIVEYYNALEKGDSTKILAIGQPKPKAAAKKTATKAAAKPASKTTQKPATATKKAADTKSTAKAKTPAKKPYLAKSTYNDWYWSGRFTADKNNKSWMAVYRGVGLAKDKVPTNSYLEPGKYVDFDKIYIKDGSWWIRFKYPTNPGAGNFYMPIGKVVTGKSFNKTKMNGAVSNLKMTTEAEELARDIQATKNMQNAAKKKAAAAKQKAPVKNPNNPKNVTAKQVVDYVMQFANNRTGIDMDGAYNKQCMDLSIAVCYNFFGWWCKGNAKDLATQPIPAGWQRIKNSPSFVPKAGDILIWNSGTFALYGHTAVATGVGNTSTFQSVDQNWFGNGSGLVPAQVITHNYSGFYGVLRPPYVA